MAVAWPNGHKFAFTVFDDTDWATVENVKPVYDLLANLGMRTTKSVWVFEAETAAINGGATCQDADYLDWVLSLQENGFEIGLHNVAPGTSSRERTVRALVRFRTLFGDRMIVHCNHFGCGESIYWGSARLTGWRRTIYGALTRGRNRTISRGHIEGDPLFWGDLCRERVNYVRNFVFNNLNTLAVCPEMPYHDPEKPFVNYWFASTNGSGIRRFLRHFTLPRVDRLVDEGGLCIAYVHFAAGFVDHGKVNPEFRRRIEYIASKDGWFAPVSAVLDHLRRGVDRAGRTISPQSLRRLELRWLGTKALEGSS